MPQQSQYPKYNRFRGFTVIEITVAIFVLTVGIVGIYSIVPRIVSIASTNTDRLIAAQLAREGVEIVRNIRDSNWISGSAWDSGLTGCSGGCEIDYDDGQLVSFLSRYLKIDGNGFYNYESGDNTKFKRKITISEDGNILNIEVEISWPGKYSPFLAREKLYNWR